MPPRITPRKFVLTFLVIIGVTLLVGSKYNFSYFTNRPTPQPIEEASNDVEEHTQRVASEKEEVKNKEILEVEKEPSNTPEQPYFVKSGTLYPTKTKGPPRLFPEQADGDRIVDQLMYVPEDYQDFHTCMNMLGEVKNESVSKIGAKKLPASMQKANKYVSPRKFSILFLTDKTTNPNSGIGYDSPEKVILLYNSLASWGQKQGSGTFQQCPVNRCSLTGERNRAGDADAILYKDHVAFPVVERPRKQVWILYHLECPYHTQSVKVPEAVNWTATYRRDSDIVAPYERWIYYDPQVKQRIQQRDYAANKTKKVAWFVSNCGARNNRLHYARELGKHIEVDIYGACGSLKCPRSDDKKCFSILDTDYKFYLAFENSNCRDYITEKLFVNGLGQNVLPIVMGARPEDYQKSAPEGSYIHVDEFASPEELAAYLHRLDNDNALYNSYFKWKGTGEFINTYFWCRLCAMLHAPQIHRHYEDVNDWWRGPGVCTTKSWRNAEFV